jgi:outer membrane protein OmpA-like peptidoglycan-associated protein/tetratricopeptide (TPR) repeat protein
MKKLVAILMMLSFTTVVIGQSMAEKRGDKFYNRLAYVKAAGLYQRAAKKKGNDHVYERLGDCYRLMGQVGKAEMWYGKVAQGAAPTAEATIHYAEALRANGKYPESQQWMSKYYTMKGDDSRAKMYSSNAMYYEDIKKQQPYFDIKNLDVNTNQADFGASFFDGQSSKVVFASGRMNKVSIQNYHTWNDQPFLNLYFADRNATSGDLSGVKSLGKKLNTKYHEGPACFTADGKTLYFTRNNYFHKKYKKDSKGINNLKIYRAKESAGVWVEENLSINSDEYSVGHPALSPDGQWLYFTSDMPGGKGMTDIWRSKIGADGSLGAAENLGEGINTEGKEMFPFLDGEGNLFYSSDGQVGLGGLDLFYAPSNKKDGFGKLTNLGLPINSTSDDFALTLDNTGKMGYFSSNREGGKGSDDIYSVTLLRPFKVTYLVKGIAKDKETGAPLENTTIALKDAQGNPVGTVTTDATGAYQFEVDPKKEYGLGGTKEKYLDGKTPFNTNELGESKTEIVKDVTLEKDPGLSLYVLVTEKSSNAPLEGVKVTILDNTNNQPFGDYSTPATGDWRKPITEKKVGDNVSYQLKIEKEGYLAKTVTYNAQITKPGPLNVHESIDLTLDKIAVGMDLAKIIDIKPIYFDLGKYVIRPDAAIELDKIVKVMNENPTMVVELGSHTDCRSSMASNEKLSANRAKASAEYIKKRITNPERIYGKGYGETILVNGCACEGAVKSTCSEEEHQKNRRTEFKIIKM